MSKNLFVLALLLLLLSCKKNNSPAPDPGTNTGTADTGLGCHDLPSPPPGFTWHDSVTDPDKAINAWVVNPVSGNELIFVVNGDIFGYNKVFSLNVPSQTLRYVTSIGDYGLQVNQKGWIVYNDVNNNIYTVKYTGDSLVKVIANYHAIDPKWDISGRNFYYLQQPYGTVIATTIVKCSMYGVPLYFLDAALPSYAIYRKTDKILYQKLNNDKVTLYEVDNVKQSERALISSTYSPNQRLNFDELIVDNNDEYFYWCNDKGVMRCNIKSLAIDTVLRNCPNYSFERPIILPSSPDELTVTVHFKRPITRNVLWHEYRAYQMNFNTRALTWVKIFQ